MQENTWYNLLSFPPPISFMATKQKPNTKEDK